MSNIDESGTGEAADPVVSAMSHPGPDDPVLGVDTPSVWAPAPPRPDSSMTVRIEGLDLSQLAWPAADQAHSGPAEMAAPQVAPAPAPQVAPAAAPQVAPAPASTAIPDTDRIVAWQPPAGSEWAPPAAVGSWAPPAAPEAGPWATPTTDGPTIDEPTTDRPATGPGWSASVPQGVPSTPLLSATPAVPWSGPSGPPTAGFDLGPAGPVPVLASSGDKRRRGKGALIGAGLGVVVLVGGGLFAARSLQGGEEANTPQAAVQSMLDAVTKEDAIGVLEALSPPERDLFLDSGIPMIEELKRLGVFDEKLDLKKVPGVKVAFTNVRFSTEELRDDLAGVRITGGAYAVSGNPAKLPFGSFVKSFMTGDELADKESQSTGDLRVNTPIVVLKDGKRWYVSLQYTIAHNAYAGQTGKGVPAIGAGVVANGAASPEAAVRDMMNAAADLDVRRMIELMPPDELAALHDYSAYFIDDAVKGVKDVRSSYDLTFPKIDLGVETKGNTAFVTIKDIEIEGKLTGADLPEARSARYAKSCLTITVDTDTKKRCGRDIVKFIEDFGGQAGDTSQLDSIGSKNGKTPKTGIVAVKRGGRWYVSPARTVLDDLTNTMKVIDRKDLDELRQQVTDITNGMSGMSVDNSTLSDSTFDATDTTLP